MKKTIDAAGIHLESVAELAARHRKCGDRLSPPFEIRSHNVSRPAIKVAGISADCETIAARRSLQ